MRRLDLQGKKFNMLLAIEYLGARKWRCRCDCGNETVVVAFDLRVGKTKSCGCFVKEQLKRGLYRNKGVKRPHKRRNFAGMKSGRLTVLSRCDDDPRMWLCQCECGNTKRVDPYNLKPGNIQSCGCLRKERYEANRKADRTTDRPEYNVWAKMIERCEVSTSEAFKNYGARGIAVCDRWRKSFTAFIEDVGCRPSKDYSLERLNNDGNYEPSNVVWATRHQQARNKRNSVLIQHDGKTLCITDWARLLGITAHTIHYRMRQGLPMDVVMSTEKFNGRSIAQSVANKKSRISFAG